MRSSQLYSSHLSSACYTPTCGTSSTFRVKNPSSCTTTTTAESSSSTFAIATARSCPCSVPKPAVQTAKLLSAVFECVPESKPSSNSLEPRLEKIDGGSPLLENQPSASTHSFKMSTKVLKKTVPKTSTTLLGCAYCPVCCIYSSHFAESCPRKAKVPGFDAKPYPNVRKTLPADRVRTFDLADEYDTYVEYCKAYNIVYPQNNKSGCRTIVEGHLKERGYTMRNPILPEWLEAECHQPFEYEAPKPKAVSSTKKLKTSKRL